jgi:2-haloalkanoic acid dehalogenase type II
MTTIAAISLDLDDTLWPVWPAIQRAEAGLLDWLRRHAPATAAAHSAETAGAARRAVVARHPEWAHDLSSLRRESIRWMLRQAGDDPALAEPAFEAFFTERHRVTLYGDVLPALARLAARWPIVALSNGNADVQRVPGLGGYFQAAVSAREFGVGKPDPAIFHHACQRLDVAPAQVLHIGDDGALDVDAALNAGLRAAWVRRADAPRPVAPQRQPHHTVPDLLALLAELPD